MIIPGSLDYGSVQVDVQYHNRMFSIKLYARLVHVIKSMNSQLQGPIPKTVHGVKTKGKAALRLIHGLAKIRDKDIDGFRIEVTVQAKGLRNAMEIVQQTPFLQPSFWLDPTQFDPALAYLKLDAKIVNKKALLANANWLYHQANASGIFDGHNTDKPSKRQIQGMTDVFAGFGWNPGQRRLTHSLESNAWWSATATTQDGGELSILEHLNRTFRTNSQQLDLLALVRKHSSFGYVPCQKNTQHRYHVHERCHLRLRCGNKQCADRIQGGEVMRWIASLVADGKLPYEAVKMQPNLQVQATPRIRWEQGIQLIRANFPVPHRNNLVRLGIRPALYRTRWVKGDGNCMFAAFANTLGDEKITHKTVRRVAVKWARTHQDFIAPFIPDEDGTVPAYLRKMSRLRTWGDHPILESLARAYNLAIAVLKKTERGPLEWFKAGEWDEASKYVGLYLEGEHYENLLGIDDVYPMI